MVNRVVDNKIQSIKDLNSIRQKHYENVEKYQHLILICSGAGCISSNCGEVKDALLKEIDAADLKSKVKINLTGCMGTCDVGPTMIIEPEGVFYCNLKPENMKKIVDRHLLENEILEEFCYKDKNTGKRIPFVKDIEFFKGQKKIALKNCGKIDCASIDEYIANNGYYALEKVLNKMNPGIVIEEIKKSGLRGRGGAGFPTGLKWKLAAKTQSSEKFVICNADEGDPGAFMDRSLLEGDPHSIIEGMSIAGYAIGANKGFVYVRAEYPLAIERLEGAITEARKRNILGKRILGSNFDFDIEIRIGAGAFVCGEETALMNSVEGKRGEPRQKPPYPSEAGLFSKPTIINNVETFGNITGIILKGADWYSKIGTAKSKGTKVFALAGDINNTGIIEVPMGITLGEVIFGIGGGVPKGKKFKVAQTGGPSGGCLTKEHLNTQIDYESLVELGAIMGSGGLICMDEDTCMVDVARFFMEFVQEESCGKCVACRLGTKRMLEILERITKGEGKEGDVELLIELGNTIKDTALCGLGQTAPNPVLSTIKYFREEYDEHIQQKYCRAGVCSDLFISPCENACPAGVNVPGYIALIAAGRVKDAYSLIMQENPFPSICGRVCTHPCESKCRRGQLDEPIAIADLKRYAADEVLKRNEPFTDLVFPKKNKSVGIIGAGPSGLTCGYYLGRLGYDVTVYESQPVAGGVLVFGIPEYRLPKEVLKKEIDVLKRVGINILTNTEVGKDISFKEIREKHDSLYIATGTQFSKKVGVKGEELPGVYHGLDFLKDVNLGKKIEINGKVAVIGGGNTAVDAARVALRHGAEEVHILYRRTIEDMPADKREILDAIEEGVIVHELIAPTEFLGQDKVEYINCVRMKLSGFDSDGRRKPHKDLQSEFLFPIDYVIPAVSQYSDLPFIGKDEVDVTNWGTFVVDNKTKMTTMPGVFAGGDVVRGSDKVITAIADGKNVASFIDKYLGGNGKLNKGEAINIPLPVDDDSELVEHERFKMEYANVETRRQNNEEVSKGFHRLNAIAEAMRCLRCDRRQ
ncbi:NADH-ubiquinone oxidoreductase-F iron-sulfur binding region domain-containing protein [Clostridium sediminicola]|uniref:NADH-ubiquinone oxidoreductase-F iron-sulfur binding region domain-containing protein n=1 Tax=Clostridium sediminicola TaxID=3114879 RepID=UPI003D17414C